MEILIVLFIILAFFVSWALLSASPTSHFDARRYTTKNIAWLTAYSQRIPREIFISSHKTVDYSLVQLAGYCDDHMDTFTRSKLQGKPFPFTGNYNHDMQHILQSGFISATPQEIHTWLEENCQLYPHIVLVPSNVGTIHKLENVDDNFFVSGLHADESCRVHFSSEASLLHYVPCYLGIKKC